MASSCAVKAWGRRWKRTSLAALIPDWTAPLIYPHHAVADSVPAKWILKHQNIVLNLDQNQILLPLLCYIIQIDQAKIWWKQVHWLLFIEKLSPCYLHVLRKSKITATCQTFFRVKLLTIFIHLHVESHTSSEVHSPVSEPLTLWRWYAIIILVLLLLLFTCRFFILLQ